MRERFIMNSSSFQKNYSDIYSDFFAKNDLILSWCFAIPWGPGWVGHRSTYVRIKSKIPMKCYVWLQKRKDKSIAFKDVIFFDLESKKFEKYEYSKVNKEEFKILDLIKDFLNKNDIEYWVDINILSEISKGHSFGFSGTSSAILATGLHLLTEKMDNKILENNKDFLKSEIFNEIADFAWKMDLVSTYFNSAWHSLRLALTETSSPTFMYTEKFDSQIDIENLNEMYTEYSSLTDKFKDTVITSEIPIDYCMVFSWISNDTKQIESFRKADSNELDKYKSFIEKDLINKEWISKNIYFKKFLNENSLYDNVFDTIVLLSIQNIALFKQLFERWYDDNIIEEFIDNINNYRHASALLEKQNDFAEDLEYLFKKNRKNVNEKIWVMPAYSWKLWWGYLIVTKPWLSRDTINKTLEDIKNNYPNAEIEYASYLDWDCSDWVKIEQYISEWIFSDYVQKDKVLYKDSNWISYIWNYEDILKKENKWILLDTITKRIYFKWQKLTSQNATIDILDILLENLWKDVSSKVFSSSSYSKNRNEMFSKIIFPLSKVVSDWGFKDFNFKSSWWITEFFVRLDKPDINIGIIRRI